MSSKYHAGQQFKMPNGRLVEVVSVRRSIHGNTSLITLRDVGGSDWPRSVRTKWLSEAIAAAARAETEAATS